MTDTSGRGAHICYFGIHAVAWKSRTRRHWPRTSHQILMDGPSYRPRVDDGRKGDQ
jgi:hypothetical protein